MQTMTYWQQDSSKLTNKTATRSQQGTYFTATQQRNARSSTQKMQCRKPSGGENLPPPKLCDASNGTWMTLGTWKSPWPSRLGRAMQSASTASASNCSGLALAACLSRERPQRTSYTARAMGCTRSLYSGCCCSRAAHHDEAFCCQLSAS